MTISTGARDAAGVEHLTAQLAALDADSIVEVLDGVLNKRHARANHTALTTLARLTLREDDLPLISSPLRLHQAAADAYTDLDIRRQAYTAVLSTPLLTSQAVAQSLHATGRNQRDMASRLRRQGTLLGVPLPSSRGIGYPAFQIDPVAGRVHPIVSIVNLALGAATDPWGVASWWVSAHARLGHPPMDLVGTERANSLEVLAKGREPAWTPDPFLAQRAAPSATSTGG